MGSLGIVMMSPSFDQHLGFTERGEDLGVQQLVPEFTVKAFVVAVFPGAPRRNVEGLDPNLGQPSRTAVATNSGPLSDRM